MSRRTMIAAAIALLLLAGIAGWFRPTQLATLAVNPHAGAWQLPTQADLERSSASQFAAIQGVAWVGSSAAVASGAADWSLLGLVGRQDDRAILVKASNDPLIKRLVPGDTLPDGSRLVSMGDDGIVIERDGCRVHRRLYPVPQDPAAPPPDKCLPGTDQ